MLDNNNKQIMLEMFKFLFFNFSFRGVAFFFDVLEHPQKGARSVYDTERKNFGLCVGKKKKAKKRMQ